MKRYRSALAAFLVTAMAAMPCAAQQASLTPQNLASEACAGCFAYLEFAPLPEPESYAMRGQATETSASSPCASEPSDLFREQALLVTSEQ